MKAILKTLFLLFVTAVCLTSDTAISSVPQASPAPFSPLAPPPLKTYQHARTLCPSAKILITSVLGLERNYSESSNSVFYMIIISVH